MTADTTATEVAAYLARVRKDWDTFAGKPVRHVPRLLAAVEAVLDLHKPEGLRRTLERCERHRDPWAESFEQAADCPDCRVIEVVTCWQGKCREEEWPCAEYRAISAALLADPES